MKLPINNNLIESHGGTAESVCGIGDMSIIFDILRNKLYSNIIESIAREISCNARDANRESNKKDIPIEIHFPNAFDENYKICDAGPGISPTRMNEIYRNYGNSTKRDSNEYTGAFGLGSKTPLAYTDQFTIKTTNQENDNTITRTYIFYIDKSRIGTISLVREENLNLPTGTEIIIPVEEKDYQAFIDGTLKSTQYWDVKPVFFGIEPLPQYSNSLGDLLAEGAGWSLYNTKKRNDWDRTKSESLAIIDGIQYKLNENFIDVADRWILSCNVHLYFDIGQLTLSASRETLQYDDNTKKLINQRIKALQKELSEQVIDIIDKKETYLEAVEFYTFITNTFYKVINKPLTWRGNKIIGEDIRIIHDVLDKMNCKIIGYFKNKSSYSRNSIKSISDGFIRIRKNQEYYFNDIDPEHIYRKKHIKALESNCNITVINYIKGKSYDDFVADLKIAHTNYFAVPNAYRHNDVDNSFIFDIIKPKLLSSVIEDKPIPGPKLLKVKVIKNEKISCYKLNNKVNIFSMRDFFIPANIDKVEEGYYIKTNFKNGHAFIKYKNTEWKFGQYELKELLKLIGDQNIYSIKENEIIKCTKLKSLSEIIEEKFNKLTTNEYYKSLAIQGLLFGYNSGYYGLFSHLNNLRSLIPYKNKIKSKNIIKYLDLIENTNNDISCDFILKLGEYLNKKSKINLYEKDIEKLFNDIKSRYKLLNCLYNVTDYNDVIEYINIIDNIQNQTDQK